MNAKPHCKSYSAKIEAPNRDSCLAVLLDLKLVNIFWSSSLWQRQVASEFHLVNVSFFFLFIGNEHILEIYKKGLSMTMKSFLLLLMLLQIV